MSIYPRKYFCDYCHDEGGCIHCRMPYDPEPEYEESGEADVAPEPVTPFMNVMYGIPRAPIQIPRAPIYPQLNRSPIGPVPETQPVMEEKESMVNHDALLATILVVIAVLVFLYFFAFYLWPALV